MPAKPPTFPISFGDDIGMWNTSSWSRQVMADHQ